MIKKSNRVLSLLLALVMVFAAFVPVAANAADESQGTKPAKKVTFNVDISRLGKTEDYDDIKLTVKKSGEEDEEYTTASTPGFERNEDNEAIYTLKLDAKDIKADADYIVSVETPDAQKGTAYSATYKTNADAKFLDKDGKELTVIDTVFSLNNDDKKAYDFTVFSVDSKNQPKPGVKFEVYNVKNDGTNYLLNEDGAYKIDKDSKIDEATTDEYGECDLLNVTSLASAAEVQGRKVVAFVVNGETVAFADLNNDKYVVLKEVPETIKVNVEVLGYVAKVDDKDAQNEAPKAVKGATVEIQKQITDIGTEKKFNTESPLYKLTTDEHGKAFFTIKKEDASWDLKKLVDYYETSAVFTEIPLVSRVMVTTADGFQVPVGASLENGVNETDEDNIFTTDTSKLAKVEVTEDADGNFTVQFVLLPTSHVLSNYMKRFAGTDRYATAVEIAKEYVGKDSDDKLNVTKNVIMASGNDFADALVANGLVGKYQSEKRPLLLVGNTLSKEVRDFLDEAKTEEVTIIGGLRAVPENVQKELEGMGIKVTRIYGTDRYETSVQVLDEIAKNEVRVSDVFLANGQNFADALVASVPSALNTKPILLTDPNKLPEVVNKAFADPDYGITKVTIVGGDKAVSNAVQASINSASVERLGGQNRQLTSMKIADAYFTPGGHAIVALGTNYPDALAAGQLGLMTKSPILLTESSTKLGDDLAKFLKTNKMTQITLVGGDRAISNEVAKQIDDILAGK